MKKKLLYRTTACALAVGLTAVLAGCGSSASSESTAESATETATAESATSETATVDESAYEYLATFNYSDGFDENGYLKGVTASDYVTLPEITPTSRSTLRSGKLPTRTSAAISAATSFPASPPPTR